MHSGNTYAIKTIMVFDPLILSILLSVNFRLVGFNFVDSDVKLTTTTAGSGGVRCYKVKTVRPGYSGLTNYR